MRLTTAVVLIWCVGAAAWAGGMPPMPVEVASAVRGPVRLVLPAVGSVRALREVSVGSRIAERVETLTVDEGDPVKKGQVVCQLDRADTKLRIAEASAELARAEALLADREAGLRENEIKQAEAAVEEQKALTKKLKLDAERTRKLFDRGVASDAERDAVVAQYETALARLHGAEAALALAREGTRKELIAQARADVEFRKAQLALVEQRLADSTIRSPVDGYVVRKHVEVGEWTQIGGAVVQVIDTSVLRVHSRVTEKQIRHIKEGQKAAVALDALPGTRFGAVVHRVVPQADTTSRSFPVQLNLRDPTGRVRAGMFARVAFALGERANVLLVPEDALVHRGGLAMVFKAVAMPAPPAGAGGAPPGQGGPPPGAAKGGPPGKQDGPPGGMPPLPGPMMIAQRVVVETGARQEGKIEIAQVVNGSLAAGELVVVVGSENLREGAPMIVVRGLPATAKPPAPARGPDAASGPPQERR